MPERPEQEKWDLVVVGAGPCGIAAGVAALRKNLSCVLFDRGCITNSLVGYPYYMTFFSTAVMLEIGDVPFTIPNAKPSRREALAYYRRVVERRGVEVRQYEEVTGVSGAEGDFRVATRKLAGGSTAVSAAAVVFATGGFHDPNLLGAPGEKLPKVRHHYREPYPYHGQRVLVVGAGNSAVEAALELHRNGAQVTMAHFADGIDRGVKPWVVPDISNRLDKGEIAAHWRSRVAEIRPESVVLRREDTGELVPVPNDFVLALTGWRADHRPLRAIGVEIDEDTDIPCHDKSTMETNVRGVYLAGVVAAGHDASKIFIENGREHGELIVAHRLRRSGGRPAGSGLLSDAGGLL